MDQEICYVILPWGFQAKITYNILSLFPPSLFPSFHFSYCNYLSNININFERIGRVWFCCVKKPMNNIHVFSCQPSKPIWIMFNIGLKTLQFYITMYGKMFLFLFRRLVGHTCYALVPNFLGFFYYVIYSKVTIHWSWVRTNVWCHWILEKYHNQVLLYLNEKILNYFTKMVAYWYVMHFI